MTIKPTYFFADMALVPTGFLTLAMIFNAHIYVFSCYGQNHDRHLMWSCAITNIQTDI